MKINSFLFAIFTILTFSSRWCLAAEKNEHWQYLNVGKFSFLYQFELAIDSRGLPHIIIHGFEDESDKEGKLIYKFWSGDKWISDNIQQKECDNYKSNLHLFLDTNDKPHIFFIEADKKKGLETIQLATLEDRNWKFQSLVSHVMISHLNIVKSADGLFHLVYDCSDDRQRLRNSKLMYISLKEIKTEEKTLLNESEEPIHRYLCSDSRNDLHISYVSQLQDGYKEIKYLYYNESKTVLRSIKKGNYSYYIPIFISRGLVPYMFAFNNNQDEIEKICISADDAKSTRIHNTKDAQLPFIAIDSSEKFHIAYVDFRNCPSGKSKLRYLEQDGDIWNRQVVDFGMNCTVQFCLDNQNLPHFLYEFSNQLKYATTSNVIKNKGKFSSVREKSTPELDYQNLPITPAAAKKLVRNLAAVQKHLKWANILEIDGYPTTESPIYHLHQYALIMDNAVEGHTATAGWYRVNAYTGQIIDDEGNVFNEGKRGKSYQKKKCKINSISKHSRFK